jgi:hypothetical protein
MLMEPPPDAPEEIALHGTDAILGVVEPDPQF